MIKTTLRISSASIISLAFLLMLSGCINGTENSTSPEPELDLIEAADSYDELSTFSEYADSLNLESQLSDSETYTLFAPDNEAFSELEGMIDTLSEEQLEKILLYHIADTALFTQQLDTEQQIPSLQGEDLFVSVRNNSVTVNAGELIGGNIRATNGVLHATNSVLLPDSYLHVFGLIAKRYELNTIESALSEAGMEGTLSENTDSGFTIFAPSNSAFEGVSAPENEEALQDTMEYFVVPQSLQSDDLQDGQMLETLQGQELEIGVEDNMITVNDSASVTTADLDGTNGVVHIIDTFLAPSE